MKAFRNAEAHIIFRNNLTSSMTRIRICRCRRRCFRHTSVKHTNVKLLLSNFVWSLCLFGGFFFSHSLFFFVFSSGLIWRQRIKGFDISCLSCKWHTNVFDELLMTEMKKKQLKINHHQKDWDDYFKKEKSMWFHRQQSYIRPEMWLRVVKFL